MSLHSGDKEWGDKAPCMIASHNVLTSVPESSHYLQHRGDDVLMSQNLSLKHLMLLEELHLGLHVAEVSSIVFCHLHHPVRHPLLGLVRDADSYRYDSPQNK